MGKNRNISSTFSITEVLLHSPGLIHSVPAKSSRLIDPKSMVPIQTMKRSWNLWGLHIGIFHEEIATGRMEVNALRAKESRHSTWLKLRFCDLSPWCPSPLVGNNICFVLDFLSWCGNSTSTRKNTYNEGMVDDRFWNSFHLPHCHFTNSISLSPSLLLIEEPTARVTPPQSQNEKDVGNGDRSDSGVRLYTYTYTYTSTYTYQCTNCINIEKKIIDSRW